MTMDRTLTSRSIERADIEALQGHFQGQLIDPHDPAYDEARRIWNAMINRRPGLIAVLQAAPNTSGWRLLQYLLRAEAGLAGDKPIDLIRGSPEDIERAVRFARRLEE